MSTDTQSLSPIPGPFTDPVDEELRCYDEHLRDLQGLSPGTRQAYLPGRTHIKFQPNTTLAR